MSNDSLDFDFPTAPNAGDLAPVKASTPLDKLRSVIEKDVTRPNVLIEVPARPGVSVWISPNFTNDQWREWRRRSLIRKSEDVDMAKFGCLVIGSLCQGIQVDGEDVTDEEGTKLTFASQEIWRMTNASNSIDAVRKFYGNDAHVIATMVKIQELAGWGEDVEEEEGNPS